MNRFIFLIIILTSTNSFSQKSIKLTKKIELSEDFVSDFYKVPNSILFYYGGHSEFSTYYKSLSKRIKKQLKKTKLNSKQIIELNEENDLSVESFEEINIKFNNKDYESVCVFFQGEMLPMKVHKSKDPFKREINYSLYMMLIESGSNKILLKKKFKVASKYTMLTENKSLSRAIVDELKLFKK